VQPFRRITSRTVVIASTDIDTDQIIPARFLTTATKEGLGKQLFADWRYQEDGSPKKEFVLNRPEAPGAQILVAGRNFGCGGFTASAPRVTGENSVA
jgi:3-isopropylmalate/(R)-2-methylmalate dehydratase small subunit